MSIVDSFLIQEVTGTDDSSESGSGPNVLKNLMIALSTLSNSVLYIVFNRRFRMEMLKVGTSLTLL